MSTNRNDHRSKQGHDSQPGNLKHSQDSLKQTNVFNLSAQWMCYWSVSSHKVKFIHSHASDQPPRSYGRLVGIWYMKKAWPRSYCMRTPYHRNLLPLLSSQTRTYLQLQISNLLPVKAPNLPMEETYSNHLPASSSMRIIQYASLSSSTLLYQNGLP